MPRKQTLGQVKILSRRTCPHAEVTFCCFMEPAGEHAARVLVTRVFDSDLTQASCQHLIKSNTLDI